MSTDTKGEQDLGTHDEHHPTERLYVKIAIILAILTAMEVSLFYIAIPAPAVWLTSLAAIKFVMVVGYFMHLKYDTRLFTQLMLTGLITALAVYGVALATFLGTTRP